MVCFAFAATATAMQEVARFLGLRPYREDELRSFVTTFRGSHHSADPITAECDRVALAEFFAPHTRALRELLREHWPDTLERWEPWQEPS